MEPMQHCRLFLSSLPSTVRLRGRGLPPRRGGPQLGETFGVEEKMSTGAIGAEGQWLGCGSLNRG